MKKVITIILLAFGMKASGQQQSYEQMQLDGDKKIILLLEKNLSLNQNILNQKDEIIKKYDASMKEKNNLINQYESNEKDMNIAMDNLKADLSKKKQGNILWKSVAASLFVGLVVNHYSWKYGGKL
jgi:hypothetical protein